MKCTIKQQRQDGFDVEMRFEGDVVDLAMSRLDMERLGADLVADADDGDLDDVQQLAIEVDGQMYSTPMSREELRRLGADLIDHARNG